MNRFEMQLGEAAAGLAEVLAKVPLQSTPPLPPDWLRCEMLERYQVLRSAPLSARSTVVEVGSGGHAIATVPLACVLGSRGRVLAVERSRWTPFFPIIRAAGVADQVRALKADGAHLPLREGGADLAVCVHGVRSLENEANMVAVFAEMLRVAPQLFVAESLPEAQTAAQRAHLAMYNLREEVFEATNGRPDDLHYLSLPRLERLVERAGAVVESAQVIEVDLPHYLAYFPRAMVQEVKDPKDRQRLLQRWDEAWGNCQRSGEDHPPVGVVVARRAAATSRSSS